MEVKSIHNITPSNPQPLDTVTELNTLVDLKLQDQVLIEHQVTLDM